jgi:alpha-ketoglutaric semialdehyde dehydrogenase
MAEAAQKVALRALNPATNEHFGPSFPEPTAEQIEAVVAAAAAAFDTYRETDLETRAAFLEAIATEIEALGDELIQTAVAETGLPVARITGERGRTCGQLRLFAQVVRRGDWIGARIDPAMPDRTPLPRADLRQRFIPLGPVVVFGASNFPLAFSTAGGDTASALAAGCPVIVKGHSAHPNTGALVGGAIAKAVKTAGLPAGVFAAPDRPAAHPGHRPGRRSAHQGRGLHRLAGRRHGLHAHRRRPSRADPGLRRDEQHQPGAADARRPGRPGRSPGQRPSSAR